MKVMASNNIISLKHVYFTYPNSKRPALSDINLDIKRGSWTSIIGHNGSGKSTITRLINGLLLPDENQNTYIVVDNQELSDDTVWNIRDKVGIVFQNPDNQFVGATVADDVAFGLENRGIEHNEMKTRVVKALEEVGMTEYATAEPSNLSGGQKQRVAIAGILAIRPKVIILDEATAMLDPNGRESILRLVKHMKERDNLTVISITHDVNESIELADNVVVVNDGKILATGDPIKVFENQAMINEIGLEEPFIFELKNKLIKAGINIPLEIDTEEKLVNYLCQLNSTM
ncbi:cobalt ABC superfamily ATP binding cassette transporter, ABC protein [Lactobacillus hamsteri DSM 5661 = JCM 6256]|uniref:Cobalt ABC superfamily ATP binding cassette transporter, ABC protein n=2 Tax=Lactobacillus hamsteri TaxID=96565 RepID=A0A0R1YLY4_9LACO|nr:cobalt ABC superfamily ATP binding cassette transporter, ABC protein [Lactobacillus hamsteri DSM 5661 = JCM 6256]